MSQKEKTTLFLPPTLFEPDVHYGPAAEGHEDPSCTKSWFSITVPKTSCIWKTVLLFLGKEQHLGLVLVDVFSREHIHDAQYEGCCILYARSSVSYQCNIKPVPTTLHESQITAMLHPCSLSQRLNLTPFHMRDTWRSSLLW